MEQNITVTMTKQEAIKYYSNKIVEDSIEDCSEFNYCMPNDYYEDNGFAKENQNEILEMIKQDERVADCHLDNNTFDMVFWTDYCPGYYDEYELSPKVESKVLRKFIDLLINIKENSIFKYSTSTREIINNLLSRNNFIIKLSEEEKEAANNMLKKFISETNFYNKYLDKDKVIITKDNVKELIIELQEKCKELEFYKQDFINVISKKQVQEMLEIFETDKIYPNKYIGCFICKDGNTFLAIDNRDGEMYIDEYKTEKECSDALFKIINGYEEEEEEENEPV